MNTDYDYIYFLYSMNGHSKGVHFKRNNVTPRATSNSSAFRFWTQWTEQDGTKGCVTGQVRYTYILKSYFIYDYYKLYMVIV